MNAKMILLILAGLLIVYLLTKKDSEGFYDNLYGDGSRSCEELCTEMHPEAARMDLDADNSIADTVMQTCLHTCRSTRGETKKCMSCA